MMRMLCAAMMLTALSGCYKAHEGTPAARQTVQFTAVADHTKGIIGTTSYPTDEPFRLSAFYGSDTTDAMAVRFIDSDIVTYDEGRAAWRTESDYYWPENGTLLFYSFSPLSAPAIITQEQGVIADYSIETVEDAQRDFCYSENIESCYQHSYNVPIVFRHALSMHCFKIRPTRNLNERIVEGFVVQDKTMEFVLDSLDLTGVFCSGRFYQKPCGWSVKPGSDTDYRLFEATPGENFATECDIRNIPIAKEVKTLLLIPQYLQGHGCKLAVYYHMHVHTVTRDGISGETKTEDYNVPCSDVVFDLGDLISRWDIAHKYSYHISLDYNKATLDIATTDWTETQELFTDE